MTIEKEIAKLENEIEAQKSTFEKMATQMPVFTHAIEFATSSNDCTLQYDSTTTTYRGPERVVVTYDTGRGSNTLATLEVITDKARPETRVTRVPYSGGARWIVIDSNPSSTAQGAWAPTVYNFAVQSAVDGTLSARMIWE